MILRAKMIFFFSVRISSAIQKKMNSVQNYSLSVCSQASNIKTKHLMDIVLVNKIFFFAQRLLVAHTVACVIIAWSIFKVRGITNSSTYLSSKVSKILFKGTYGSAKWHKTYMIRVLISCIISS